MTSVAVAMINHNYGRFLKGAIESVLQQSRPPDRLVVVDDGSTDNSLDVLRSFGPRVELVEQGNSGPAAATNAALARCAEDVVLMLDSDDLMLSDRIERVVEVYEADPGVAWVWHEVIRIDRESQQPLDDQPPPPLTGSVDVRVAARAGRRRLGVAAPATSGLSFRQSLLSQMTPLPADLRAQDTFLKFAALALGRGHFLAAPLSLQGIHQCNLWTGGARPDRRAVLAEDFAAMARGFRSRDGDLSRMADYFAAQGLYLACTSSGVPPHVRLGALRYLSSTGWRGRAQVSALVARSAVQDGIARVGGVRRWGGPGRGR